MAPATRPAPRDRVWLHVLLFLLTLLSTTSIGLDHYVSFLGEFGTRPVIIRSSAAILSGFWYSGTILAILGAHEMGHYLACRYYGINASLPFFLPAPIVLTGTLGAVIRIREPIRRKTQLFDMAVAGPLAGFAVAVPALVIGLAMSRVSRLPASLPGGLELGEPVLFQVVARALWGAVPDGYSLNLHPVAFAAWFGLMATLLNLIPFSQLDGGHIVYAVFGRRSRYVSLGAVAAVLGLALYAPWSWTIWALLMLVALWFLGPGHPPTVDEDQPLDASRRWLALAALVVFVLCFTPSPIEPLDLLTR